MYGYVTHVGFIWKGLFSAVSRRYEGEKKDDFGMVAQTG